MTLNELEIDLPYPPSGNHMWKHTRGGAHYLTAKARDYYFHVLSEVGRQQAALGINLPVIVTCQLYPPDKRRRDLDNAWKVIADGLTKAGVWEDDKFIRKLTLEWMEPVKGGRVEVFICPFR